MGMRRRPLARAAVVGGVAYHAGKKGAQNAANEQAQNEQIADLQAQQQYAPPPQQYAPPPPPPQTGMDDKLAQLKELGELKAAGVLSEPEFEQQKARILAG